ncbi:hypothetical protein Hanom_Chr04g00339811 [Helianthus anomalus]
MPKGKDISNLFGVLLHATGVYKGDLGLDGDFDVFNNAEVKALEKKVSDLEKEKAKAESKCDELKKQVEELTKVNEEIKTVMIKQHKKFKKMKEDVHDNSQLFELLSAENAEMREKMKNLHEVNQTLNQLLSEINEASSNEMKALKLEMEAIKVDKVMKDEQLAMLYTVMEHHLGIDVHSVFNSIEIKKAEERRIERERRLAEEASQRKKTVIVDTQEGGGSSSQVDVEMVDAQSKKKAKKVLLLKWKEEEEVFEEEKEDEDDKINDDVFDCIDNYPEGDDDDHGTSGLLIVNPNVQQRIEDFMNDEINEQKDDQHQEASSSGKQHAGQVFVTQPTVIFLHAPVEGELEIPRSRVEMLEELGLDDGKFKFDTEDEIPSSPEREYEFVYVAKADKYDEVLVEDGSDSSDEETDFHYSGVDETFPSFAKMFKYRNEDEIRRKIVKKISTEGVPKTIPRENLAHERKKWFKVMLKERKFIRALQYFTHDKDISWGTFYRVQYFEYLVDIKTLPWWDVDELVQTKNIKQYYYGLDVKVHNQHLWDYVKQQSKARYPDWKPQFPKQIVTYLESGEKDVTLDVKPPRCLKNMPLRSMEQDFHEDFEGWLYNESTT